ncbi:MAG: exonuclease SbcCD subunit D C-terminal domain-containing protein [Ruminococcus sp.]
MDSEIRTVGNIDQVSADILQKFDYAALGHIHKPMKAGGEFYRYCGTPLACSVSEAGQNKGIIMVDIKQKGEITTEVIPLEPLRQIKVIKGDLESVLAQRCKDYVTVILTDKVDLDVIDMQDRLRLAFPGLLEIRRETVRQVDYTRHADSERELNPFELCCQFLGNADAEEQEILQEVINTVQEVTK